MVKKQKQNQMKKMSDILREELVKFKDNGANTDDMLCFAEGFERACDRINRLLRGIEKL